MAAGNTALQALSDELAQVVERVVPSVVRVDDGIHMDDGSLVTATGLIWSNDGLILTISRGLNRDENLTVELHDGTRLPATLVGRDGDTDLALLRVQAPGLTPVERASEVKVGHLVLALGRPGLAGLQATIGIVSARLESESGGQAEHLLHTDATLYPGFSGGPLCDVQGRMVGLTNRGFGRGMGVALGVPILERVVGSLQNEGSVKRGFLGIGTQAVVLPQALRQSLGLEQERGLLIAGVQSPGPAEAGGLMLGDVILKIQGETIQDAEELRRQLRAMNAGQSVTMGLLRGGQQHDLSVVLGAQE